MKNIAYSLPCLYGAGFYNDKNLAIAFVNNQGKTNLKSSKNNTSFPLSKIPFVRGLMFLIFGTYNFVANFVQSPISFKRNKFINGASNTLNISHRYVLSFCLAIITIIISFLVMGFLPSKIAVLISGYNYNLFLKKFIVALIKVTIIYLTFVVIKFIAPFRQLYRFNSACNVPLIKNNKEKQFYHLPTNYLNFVLTGFIFSNFTVALLGLTTNAFYKPLINLVITILVFCVVYELLFLIEKSKYKWVNSICVITSWLVNEKPSKTEINVVNTALNEVILMQDKRRKELSGQSVSDNEINFSFVYGEIKQKFNQAGIDEPSDIDWLLCECLNVSRSKLKLMEFVTKSQYKKINLAVQRRIKGEPITKIFGRTEFYGLEFIVTKDVLSPRMETEILVEQVLKLTNSKMNILDIGTGSGAIAVSVAKFSGAKVTAVDISQKALEVAKQNAEKNNVKINFKCSNLFTELKKKKIFDIVVSNPPYIKSEDIDKLDVEVKNYDPILALDGGDDGLIYYKKIIEQAPMYLKDKGVIAFEIGIGQEKDLKNLLKTDFENIKVIKDYNKISRVVIANLK